MWSNRNQHIARRSVTGQPYFGKQFVINSNFDRCINYDPPNSTSIYMLQRNPHPSILVAYCCLSKLTQIQWLKTAQIYSLTVQEVRSPKNQGRQGCIPSGGSRGKFSPLPFLASRLPAFLGSWTNSPSSTEFQSSAASSKLWPSCLPIVRTLVTTLSPPR